MQVVSSKQQRQKEKVPKSHPYLLTSSKLCVLTFQWYLTQTRDFPRNGCQELYKGHIHHGPVGHSKRKHLGFQCQPCSGLCLRNHHLQKRGWNVRGCIRRDLPPTYRVLEHSSGSTAKEILKAKGSFPGRFYSHNKSMNNSCEGNTVLPRWEISLNRPTCMNKSLSGLILHRHTKLTCLTYILETILHPSLFYWLRITCTVSSEPVNTMWMTLW